MSVLRLSGAFLRIVSSEYPCGCEAVFRPLNHHRHDQCWHHVIPSNFHSASPPVRNDLMGTSVEMEDEGHAKQGISGEGPLRSIASPPFAR